MLREALKQSGVAGLIGWKDTKDEQDNIFRRALAAALYPFQLLITPTAIKTYLTTILFLVTSFVLLSISTTAYAFFYYKYIPQTDLERPIYLQYGTDTFPQAEVALDTNALVSQQPYDVSIVLHMPRDPTNLSAGNFMLDLKLHGKTDKLASTVLGSLGMEDQVSSTALHHSRRPAIMPYSSTSIGLISKLIHLPFHFLSSYDADSVTLTVPMFEGVVFARGVDHIPAVAEIQVQSQWAPMISPGAAHFFPQLRTYSAKLVFQVRFRGLRYLIYNHRVLAFIVFTSLFYTVSISTLALVWAVIATLLSTSQSQDQSLMKQEKKVKQEADTTDHVRSASEYKSDNTQKRLKEEPEDETVNLNGTWPSPHQQQSQRTLQTSEPAFASSQEPNIPAGGQPEEHADDEEEESEDEFQQLERIRKRMEYDARQRQMAHDSGLGTSLESENGSKSNVVRRTGSRRGSGRE